MGPKRVVGGLQPMYRIEFHCSRCNRIYQLPMKGGICPNDAQFLDLEFATVSIKPEK